MIEPQESTVADTIGENLEERRRAVEALRSEVEMRKLEAEAAAIGRVYIDDALESIYDLENYVNPYDYVRGGPSGAYGPNYSALVSTSIADRDRGQNYPIFRNEHELATIRGLGRMLFDASSIGKGVMRHLTNYAVGTGSQVNIESDAGTLESAASEAQKIIDRFRKRNAWNGALDREAFLRLHRDGEVFIALTETDGEVELRFVEPDNVLKPGATREIEDWLGIADSVRSCWEFGIHADEDDAVNTHGFYVQWTPQPTEWDYVPGGRDPIDPPQPTNVRMLHFKTNVDSNVKRGLSDFFACSQVAPRITKLRENIIAAAIGQSAIAWYERPMPGQTANSNLELIKDLSTYRVDKKTPTGGRRIEYVKTMEPGSVVTTPRDIIEGPAASRGEQFVKVLEAGERSLAMRWGMPEHFVTGSAKNNNFASIVVASDPFTRAMEAEQAGLKRQEEAIYWEVLRLAWQAGRLPGVDFEILRESLTISVELPTVEVRDRPAETNRYKVLRDERVMSRRTWRDREGLDESEAELIEQELEEDMQRAQQEIALGLRPDPRAMGGDDGDDDPRAGGDQGGKQGAPGGTGAAGPKQKGKRKPKGESGEDKQPTKSQLESIADIVKTAYEGD